MATQYADPTLAFLAKLDDKTKFVAVPNVPIFVPHDRETTDKDGKQMNISVGVEDLGPIAAQINQREAEFGVPPVMTIGHRQQANPAYPEKDQPAVVGYVRNAHVGVFGPSSKPAVLATLYYSKEEWPEAKKYPFRSVDFYPGSNKVTGLALLKRDPFLPMGVVSYQAAAQATPVEYAGGGPAAYISDSLKAKVAAARLLKPRTKGVFSFRGPKYIDPHGNLSRDPHFHFNKHASLPTIVLAGRGGIPHGAEVPVGVDRKTPGKLAASDVWFHVDHHDNITTGDLHPSEHKDLSSHAERHELSPHLLQIEELRSHESNLQRTLSNHLNLEKEPPEALRRKYDDLRMGISNAHGVLADRLLDQGHPHADIVVAKAKEKGFRYSEPDTPVLYGVPTEYIRSALETVTGGIGGAMLGGAVGMPIVGAGLGAIALPKIAKQFANTKGGEPSRRGPASYGIAGAALGAIPGLAFGPIGAVGSAAMGHMAESALTNDDDGSGEPSQSESYRAPPGGIILCGYNFRTGMHIPPKYAAAMTSEDKSACRVTNGDSGSMGAQYVSQGLKASVAAQRVFRPRTTGNTGSMVNKGRIGSEGDTFANRKASLISPGMKMGGAALAGIGGGLLLSRAFGSKKKEEEPVPEQYAKGGFLAGLKNFGGKLGQNRMVTHGLTGAAGGALVGGAKSLLDGDDSDTTLKNMGKGAAIGGVGGASLGFLRGTPPQAKAGNSAGSKLAGSQADRIKPPDGHGPWSPEQRAMLDEYHPPGKQSQVISGPKKEENVPTVGPWHEKPTIPAHHENPRHKGMTDEDNKKLGSLDSSFSDDAFKASAERVNAPLGWDGDNADEATRRSFHKKTPKKVVDNSGAKILSREEATAAPRRETKLQTVTPLPNLQSRGGADGKTNDWWNEDEMVKRLQSPEDPVMYWVPMAVMAAGSLAPLAADAMSPPSAPTSTKPVKMQAPVNFAAGSILKAPKGGIKLGGFNFGTGMAIPQKFAAQMTPDQYAMCRGNEETAPVATYDFKTAGLDEETSSQLKDFLANQEKNKDLDRRADRSYLGSIAGGVVGAGVGGLGGYLSAKYSPSNRSVHPHDAAIIMSLIGSGVGAGLGSVGGYFDVGRKTLGFSSSKAPATYAVKDFKDAGSSLGQGVWDAAKAIGRIPLKLPEWMKGGKVKELLRKAAEDERFHKAARMAAIGGAGSGAMTLATGGGLRDAFGNTISGAVGGGLLSAADQTLEGSFSKPTQAQYDGPSSYGFLDNLKKAYRDPRNRRLAKSAAKGSGIGAIGGAATGMVSGLVGGNSLWHAASKAASFGAAGTVAGGFGGLSAGLVRESSDSILANRRALHAQETQDIRDIERGHYENLRIRGRHELAHRGARPDDDAADKSVASAIAAARASHQRPAGHGLANLVDAVGPVIPHSDGESPVVYGIYERLKAVASNSVVQRAGQHAALGGLIGLVRKPSEDETRVGNTIRGAGIGGGIGAFTEGVRKNADNLSPYPRRMIQGAASLGGLVATGSVARGRRGREALDDIVGGVGMGALSGIGKAAIDKEKERFLQNDPFQRDPVYNPHEAIPRHEQEGLISLGRAARARDGEIAGMQYDDHDDKKVITAPPEGIILNGRKYEGGTAIPNSLVAEMSPDQRARCGVAQNEAKPYWAKLAALGSRVMANPIARETITQGGIGAATGGALTALSGGDMEDVGKAAAQGGIAGGISGAAMGTADRFFGDSKTPKTQAASTTSPTPKEQPKTADSPFFSTQAQYLRLAPPVRYEAVHAPAGGVSIAGHKFVGGQFIPSDVMAKASPAEKIALGNAQKTSGKEVPSGHLQEDLADFISTASPDVREELLEHLGTTMTGKVGDYISKATPEELHELSRRLVEKEAASGNAAVSPKGGVTIRGYHFAEGQSIPPNFLRHATPEQIKEIEGKSGRSWAKKALIAGSLLAAGAAGLAGTLYLRKKLQEGKTVADVGQGLWDTLTKSVGGQFKATPPPPQSAEPKPPRHEEAASRNKPPLPVASPPPATPIKLPRGHRLAGDIESVDSEGNGIEKGTGRRARKFNARGQSQSKWDEWPWIVDDHDPPRPLKHGEVWDHTTQKFITATGSSPTTLPLSVHKAQAEIEARLAEEEVRKKAKAPVRSLPADEFARQKFLNARMRKAGVLQGSKAVEPSLHADGIYRDKFWNEVNPKTGEVLQSDAVPTTYTSAPSPVRPSTQHTGRLPLLGKPVVLKVSV